jgi:uncharacterized protein (TIGR02453 family)
VSFAGFPADGLAFFAELDADNSRTFWLANKARYDANVKQPMLALTTGPLAEFGPFHTFRPYNDVRFAKGRPPYKTHIGSYGEVEGGAGYYVHLAGDGLMVGGGYYSMAADQLERFREAVVDDARGSEAAELCAALEAKKYGMSAISSLKTAPRGYAKDHPRIELLRRKGLIATRTFGTPAWLHTKRAGTEVVKAWTEMAPLCHWLNTHVGPSTLPPDESGRMF